MNPNENTVLGGIERPHDPRDIKLGAVQAPVSRPATFLEDVSSLPTYYQGRQPACGAHAGAWFKARKDTRDTGVVANYTPKFIWDEIKTLDGFPLEVGTDMRSIFKELRNIGACDYDLLPNTIDQSLQEYSDPKQITPAMLQNASGKKLDSNAYAFRDTPTFDQVCDDIWINKELLLLIRCDEGFFGTTTPTFTTPKYGHFITPFGYAGDYAYVKDSTEEDPAFSIKKIHKQYFQPQFIRESGTAKNINPLVIWVATHRNDAIRKLISLYTMLLKFYPPKVATPTTS